MSVCKIFPRSLGSYVVTVLLEVETCYVIPTMKKGIVKKLDWVPTMDGQPRLRLMNGFKSNVIVLVSTYIARSIFCHISIVIRKVTNTFFLQSNKCRCVEWAQWFGSYLNPHATSGDDTSAKLSLWPPFTSPVQWHLLILAFLGLKGLFVFLTLCSSAFCH